MFELKMNQINQNVTFRAVTHEVRHQGGGQYQYSYPNVLQPAYQGIVTGYRNSLKHVQINFLSSHYSLSLPWTIDRGRYSHHPEGSASGNGRLRRSANDDLLLEATFIVDWCPL
jgi:hypothetical protein